MTVLSHDRAAREWLAAFGAAGAPATGFAPATLKQALDGALELGRAAGRLKEAMRVLADIELRLGALGTRLGIDRRAGTVAGAPAPRIAIVSAVYPNGAVLTGRWAPDMAALAGARTVLSNSGGPDRMVTPGDLGRAGAEAVVFALVDTAQEDAVAKVRETWTERDWRLLYDTPLVVLDGRRFINVAGPDLARSVELIAAAVHGATSGVLVQKDELVDLRGNVAPRE